MGPRRLEVEERAAICNTQSFIGISDTLVSLGPGALLTGVLLIIVIGCEPPGDQVVVSPSSGDW